MATECPSCPGFCGLDAVGVVRRLAGNCRASDELTFISYKPGPGIADRLGVRPARLFPCKTVDELLTHEPDAAALVGKIRGGPVTDAETRSRYSTVPAADVRDGRLNVAAMLGQPEWVVAFTSTCQPSRRFAWPQHFAMLDFRADAPATGSPAAARVVEVIARALIAIKAPDGVILRTGKSYHYYGLAPLEEREWRGFMQRALLLEPLIDVRYIAHRLLSGKAALRITESNDKPDVPHVVACLVQERWSICP